MTEERRRVARGSGLRMKERRKKVKDEKRNGTRRGTDRGVMENMGGNRESEIIDGRRKLKNGEGENKKEKENRLLCENELILVK